MDRSDLCGTIKVKPWAADQGDFVEINAEDFDPKRHKPLSSEEAAKVLIASAQPGEAMLAAPADASPSASEEAVAAAAKPVAKAKAKKPARKSKAK